MGIGVFPQGFRKADANGAGLFFFEMIQGVPVIFLLTAGVIFQDPGIVGGHHFLAVVAKKHGAEFLFQGTHVLGHCRLGNV